MLTAHYIGDHSGDDLTARVGAALIRWGQKGAFDRVTHTEAILAVHGPGVATIASASLRDGGVRIKAGVRMNPANWIVVDVPQWDVVRAAQWFRAHVGDAYDWRGAAATMLPGAHVGGRWFCNETVGAAVGLLEPHTFTPSQFCAICMSLGRDVTAAFFAGDPIT